MLVQFFKNPDKTIFAFFPSEHYYSRGNEDYEKVYMSYEHLGQHGPCHIDYVKEQKKATPKEYKELLNELVSIGYNNLDVY